jgi:hypothetical protein
MHRSTTKYYTLFFILSILTFAFFTSCEKDPFNGNQPDIALKFSNDSIVFDTVFTSIGSITKQLKIYNPFNQKITINSIELNKGANSAYRLNIDGEASLKAENIELEGKDSLYIFIKVLINPNDINSPFVVDDYIQFTTQGYSQKVSLVAWGQNANYIIADQTIEGLPPFKIIASENEIIEWDNTLPYLIYGYAVVDSGAQLQIHEGAKVHFHNNSGLWIYKGASLKVNGTLENPVIFEGDRLDEDYRDISGQWDRIWINEGSIDNEINYAIIKNGFIGIQAETLDEPLGNSLILNNTEITNMSGSGILARNYQINAKNNLVTNCGNYLLALTLGGNYRFIHSTFANYWNHSARQTPSIYLNNYYEDDDGTTISQDFESFFGNCIIDGQLNEELSIDLDDVSNTHFLFDHNSLRTKIDFQNDDRFKECISNSDFLFLDAYEFNFQLDTLSPAIDKASVQIALEAPFDILGQARSQNPDLGVFEFILQK